LRSAAGEVAHPFVLLFGALPRKQAEPTLVALERGALATFVTRADGQPISVATTGSRRRLEDPREALAAALAACPPGATLVIAGSLYLAGELRPVLRQAAAAGKTGRNREPAAGPPHR